MKINKKQCSIMLIIIITFLLTVSAVSANQLANNTKTEKINQTAQTTNTQKQITKTTNSTLKTHTTYANSTAKDNRSGKSKSQATTLEQAIENAQENETIFLTSTKNSDTYKLNEAISIYSRYDRNNITIQAESGKTIIFDGQNQTGIFNIYSMTVTLKNIQIINTQTTRGAIYSSNSHIILDNCIIQNNQATANAPITAKNSEITIKDSTIKNNQGYHAGAMLLQETTTTVTNTRFINNTAQQLGGAITHLGNTTLTVKKSTFTQNSASYDGGSIYTVQSNAVITSSYFTNNRARNGGALYLGNNVNNIKFTLTKNTFTNNRATQTADAIWTNYDITANDNVFVSSRNTNWITINKNRKVNLNSNWWSRNSPDFSTITDEYIPDNWRIMTTTGTTKITVTINKLSDLTTAKSILPTRTAIFTASSGKFQSTIKSITSTTTNTYTGKSTNKTVRIDNEEMKINTKPEAYLSINNITSTAGSTIIFKVVANRAINDKITLNVNNKTFTKTLVTGQANISYTIPKAWKAQNYTTTLTFKANKNFKAKTVYGYLKVKENSKITVSPVNTTDIKLLTSKLPSSYDLRKEKLVTSVKTQGGSGSCWAFESIASLESVLLKKTGTKTDLSENNMKNVLNKYSTIGDASNNPNAGNNDFEPIGMLVGWYAPVNETDDPYDSTSIVSPVFNSSLHIQDVYIIPNRKNTTDNELIKQAVYNYGAVSTGVKSPSSTNSYTTGEIITHGVTIVGWDDNYSRKKFSPNPPGNGAFIVKNNWGNDSGDKGYYYISYYDTTIGSLNATEVEQVNYVVLLENNDNYTNIYQYDTVVQSLNTYSSSIGYRNVYTAQKDENIASIGSYFLQKSKYEVKIEVNGKQVYTQKGTVTLPGYRTIRLKKFVQVNKDDEFTVTLLINRSKTGPQNIFVQYADKYYSQAAAQQSYLMFNNDDIWIDLYDKECTAPIKVYTKDTPKVSSTATNTNGNITVITTVKDFTSKGKLTYYINSKQVKLNAKAVTKTVNGESTIVTTFTDTTKSSQAKIKVIFASENYQISQEITTQNKKLNKTTLTLTTNTKTLKSGNNITITGKLSGNKQMSNVKLSVTVNNDTKTVKTDINGNYKLTTPLTKSGNNTIIVKYAGNQLYNPAIAATTVSVTKKSTALTINKVAISTYGKKVTISGYLKSANKPVTDETVNIDVNGIGYITTTGNNGYYKVTHTVISYDDHIITAKYYGNDKYVSSEATTTFKIRTRPTITLNKLTGVSNPSTITIKGRLTVQSSPLKKQKVQMTINSQSYTLTTDSTGIFSKKYSVKNLNKIKVTAKYSGSSLYYSTTSKTTITPKLKTTITLNSLKTVNINKNVKISGKLSNNKKAVRNENVTISINAKKYTTKTLSNGYFSITYKVKNYNTQKITVTHKESTKYLHSTKTTKFEVFKPTRIVANKISTTNYGKTIKISGKLYYGKKAVKGEKITVIVDGKRHTATTLTSGYFSIKYKIKSYGKHKVTFTHVKTKQYLASKNATSFITVEPTTLKLNKIKTQKLGKTVKISGKLLKTKNKSLKSQKIKITVNGKKYSTTTLSSGYFSISYKLSNTKTQKITVNYSGNALYAASKSTTSFKVTA